MMKRVRLFSLLAASGTAIALFAFPSTLPASAANGNPTRTLVPNEPLDFPAGQACSFELASTPLVNNEFLTTFPAEANGDIRENATGTLKLHLTNVDTGKSIVVNVSGPGTVILHPDGSTSTDLRGTDLVVFFPTSTPAGPATYLYTGNTVLSADAAGNLTLVSTTDTKPVNVCTALS